MDSRRKPDLISSLEDVYLVMIISLLPFEEAVRTSVLSPRWRSLYLQTKNIAFKEPKVLKSSGSNDEVTKREARVSFVRSMVTWVSRFPGKVVESLEICLCKPFGFETEIRQVVEFAVSKGVKNLVLDFSDHSWSSSNEAKRESNVFQLPECVYQSTTLESLKLFFCGFVPASFANPGSMNSLCFGWIQLRRVMALLPHCPLLESLSMTNCWNVGLEAITNSNKRIRELTYKNCELTEPFSMLDLPRIEIFKYSGTFHLFQFMDVNRFMKEAELDFEAATEYDNGTGTLLTNMLCDLLLAKKLTVCPYLIQLIQESDDPIRLQAPMETKHLVMKTSMQANEFVGIRLMINSSPLLESLTFVLVHPPRLVLPTPAGVDVEKYWTLPITHRCVRQTLKFVEVKNFRGSFCEVLVLQYLIRYGRVLERMDLHVAEGLDRTAKMLARAAGSVLGMNFKRGSNRLRIFVHMMLEDGLEIRSVSG